MTTLIELAPAKLNLFLHITGKRPDGYHELLTHVVFTEFGDRLSFAPSDVLTCAVTGEFADACGGEDNLVLRAARRLRQRSGTAQGAHITLEKNIPVGAGLGGGSADAAAVLRGLNRLWNLSLPRAELLEMAEDLGADVPMCLYSEPLYASGTGEEITPHTWTEDEDTFLHVVLVHPRVTLMTAQVFALLTPEEVERGRFPLTHGYGEPLANTRNDLQRAAIAAQPLVGEVLHAMESTPSDAMIVRMTGSGSCCFALFHDEAAAQRYGDTLRAQYPRWWVRVTKARA